VLLTQGDRGLRAVRQEHGVSGVLKERSYHGADTGLIVSHRILRGSLKQGCRAVPLIVMGLPFRQAWPDVRWPDSNLVLELSSGSLLIDTEQGNAVGAVHIRH
jgi:hypothetical protein